MPDNIENDDLSLRDQLDAAFEQTETTDDGTTATAPAPVVAEAPADDSGQTRDASGRFATKAPAPDVPTPAPLPPNGAGAQAPAPLAEALKAPASWKPEAREQWGTVPAALQAEIHRREQETNRLVQDGAQQRQFMQAFESMVRPYEMFIRAENSTPLQAVQNMMQVAAELRVGTTQSKAQLIANIIRQHGVDLQTLDGLLAGDPSITMQQAAQGQYRDPRVDQLLQNQARETQQRQQQETQWAQQHIAEFAASHEFWNDVAADVNELAQLAIRRGDQLDLKRLYDRACALHPEVSKILSTRAASSQPATPQHSQAVLRAKRAAVSPRNESTPNSGATIPKDDSLRASLEAAFNDQGNRI